MIYSVDFLDMTEKLNPLAVSKYLDVMGWIQYPLKRNDIKIYQITMNGFFQQVTIPIEKTLRDYKQTMYETIKKIADIENKSIEQLMLYLLNPNTDILRIRLDNKEVEVGNILFDDAIKLYDSAKKLLAATALDIINPKKIHYGRIDDSVQKFLKGCRFGQTEIGSYIVSVVCPFADLINREGYKQLSIFSDEEQCANSLTRQVTNRVMKNITVIKQKIDEGNIDSLVDGEIEISSNFYEALNGLNSQSENTVLEITAEWSPTVKSNRCEYNYVKITNDYYQPIETIVEKIKRNTNEQTEVVGKIKQLTAAPIVDKREKGTIVVVYVGNDNKAKSVSVILGREDYENAVEAHRQGKTVKIIGDLVGVNKSKMDNVIFSIVD